ncbi:MAG TPA: hypothetical protein DCE78_00715 [Bacteroidetes bacterium]|nr:hypothetical protein [Bacteroidota bacterium]
MAESVKILVIEDDEIDRLAFKRAAKLYHLPIVTTMATSIDEAKIALQQDSFDVIFTDYYLDDGDAKDVIEMSGSTPVLVATGTNDIQIAVDILKNGAYDFLVKDIDRSYLRVLPYTIEKVLQKKAALQDQRILSSVVTNIRDNVVIIDSSDTIIFVNPAFCETYGYTEAEITGMPVSIIIPMEFRNDPDTFLVRNKPVDQVHVKKSGKTINVSTTISDLSDQNSDSTKRIIVTRDVSERTQMLIQLRDSQKQLRTIFDNSAVGIGLFHTDGKLIQFNSKLSELLGYNNEDLYGKNLNELSHQADQHIDRDNYIKLLKNKIDSYTAERRLIRSTGEIVWTRLNISLVRESDLDKALYTIVIFEDITDRKEIEKALKASEVRVEGIVTSLKDVVYSIDPGTTKIQYVNQAVSEVFEMSPNEFMHDLKHWTKMIHGGDLQKVLNAQQEILKDGKVELEYRIISPAGNIKWIRDRSWIVYNEDHEIERIDGIITDISKRKVAEQAHRDSEERYRTAVQSSVEAIYMLNPINSQVIEANDAFCNLLGYTHEEALTLNILDFVKGDYNSVSSLINFILDTGGGQLGERNWIKKDGTEIVVQVNGSRIRQRDQETLFVVARDITEEKKFTDKLEKERKLLKEVVSNAPIPMALLDENLRFILYSKTWIQAYGAAREKLEGKYLFDVYKQIPTDWVGYCERGVKGEVLSIPEQEVTAADGSKIYLRLAIHPWGDLNNQQNGIVIAAERIDELVHARKQAENANLAKSAFLARITHELRTPLNAVLGYSQIMIKDTDLSDTHKAYVGSMYRSGMHLLNMINDILDLSKIEASKMDLQMGSVNLTELLSDLFEMFRMRCENKGLELVFEIDERLNPMVWTDRSKLNQVLINLLGNAIKFTNRGKVLMKLELLKYLETDHTQQIQISVQDTGIGIPEEDVQKVFEAFHQSSNADNQGTGLGLSITQKIVELFGGHIKVESKIGVGSEFIVTIPLEISDVSASEEGDKFNHVIGILGNKVPKVLIADDVLHNRHVVRLLMERIGFEVIEAENGEEAVNQFKKHNPDFIIMDIIMPVMDGVKAMHAIKKMKLGKSTPIIALTASGFDDKREQLINAGFDDYVLKPFTEAILLKSIADHSHIEFIFEKTSDNQLESPVEITVLSALEDWNNLDVSVQQKLFEHIEIQELEEIKKIANDTEMKKNSPYLSSLLRKSAEDFDFFKLNQLLEVISKSSGNDF